MVATALATLVAASGLHGVVMRGPTTPVCRVGIPCSEPAAGATIAFTRASVTVRTKTDRHGLYRIALAPGRWKVGIGPQRIGSGIRPTVAVVPAGRFALVNLEIDTGIR